MEKGKKFLRSSNEEYVFGEHDMDLDRFMHKYIEFESHNDFVNLVMEHIGEFRVILQDWISPMNKKIDYLINSFANGYRLMLVAGARDSGKTAFGFYLIEQVHNKYPKRRIAYIGVKINKKFLPSWCENYTIEEYEEMVNSNRLNGYIVLIDEAAIFFNARKWQDKANIKFGQLIAISRHKFISLIVLAQDHNMTDTNIWRLRDMVVYKKSNTYELSDRDTKGSSRASKIQKFWKYIKQWMHPRKKNEALFEYQSEKRLMLIEHPLPTFWSDTLSKGFNQFKIEDTPVIIKQINKEILEEKNISGVS
mgnify:CR=1 FL=1